MAVDWPGANLVWERRRTELRSKPDAETSAICAALERQYRSPRHGNKDEPLDELFYIILSTRTQDRSFRGAYERLKANYPTWDDIRSNDEPRIATLIQRSGLASLKAMQIVQIVDRLRAAFGTATLDPLWSMTDAEAESFLTSLPGVAAKVAKCVMMYSLGRPVLPVDVHVHRVAARLGYPVKRRPDTSQQLIEDAFPPALRYGFHVNAVAHGRAICVPRNPRCHECVVSRWCDYYRLQGVADVRTAS